MFQKNQKWLIFYSLGYRAKIYIFEKPLKNMEEIKDVNIFQKWKYLILNIFPTFFFNFFKNLPCTLVLEIHRSLICFLISRPWKVGTGTCIKLPYLNSVGKIMGGTSPQSILDIDNNSPSGLGLKRYSK